MVSERAFKVTEKEYGLICEALLMAERMNIVISNNESRLLSKRQAATELAGRLNNIRIKLGQQMFAERGSK